MFFSVEDKVASGFKAAKNCFTLLFDGNASGDYKIKLLMVYCPENPGALKGYLKWFCLFYGNLIRNPGLQQVPVYVPFAILLLLLHNALGHLPRISVTDEDINVTFQHPNITFLLCCLRPVAYYYVVLLYSYNCQHNKFIINQYYCIDIHLLCTFSMSNTFHEYCLMMIQLDRNM
jgi:hypothetical protein